MRAMLGSADHITVRDWRRKPPLRLRVTKRLHIHWCWIKCTRCDHMRAVAIAPFVIRWVAGHVACDGAMHGLRQAGRGATASLVGLLGHRLRADADQSDGAREAGLPIRGLRLLLASRARPGPTA